MLVRNYNEDIGASYDEAFGTESRGEVEALLPGQRHRVRVAVRRRPASPGSAASAVVTHPVTGQRCWFNQVAFLNEWTIEPEVREYLVEVYGPDGLPFNTRFGNGDPFGEDVVQVINEIYEAHTLREPWQAGDLMLVDNIRDGAQPGALQGDREILVAWATRCGWAAASHDPPSLSTYQSPTCLSNSPSRRSR